MGPRVSVVVTAYNHGALIDETLRSAVAQTYAAAELIVVDDGSTDDTAARVAAFGRRVRYIRQPNLGVAASRNTGVAAARGPLVAFLDGDDLWEPGTLDAQVRAFHAQPGVGLVAVDGIQFAAGETLRTSLLREEALPPAGTAEAVTVTCYPELVAGNIIATVSQVMVPKAVLDAVGPSDVRYRTSSDYDLYLRIAARHQFTFVRRRLVRWRYIPTSASGPKEARRLRWWREDIAILKQRLASAPGAERCLLRNALRARVTAAAREAYNYGRAYDPGLAHAYLIGLLTERVRWPAVLLLLAALHTPRRILAWLPRGQRR